MEKVIVRSSSGAYPIVSGSGALGRLGGLLAREADVSGVFVISSPRVWKHCRRVVEKALAVHETVRLTHRLRSGQEPDPTGARGRRLRAILFDDAESAKNIRTVESLTRGLARAGADRRSVIVAVGGGVVGDVGGFVAASYLRGVRLVHVPTTLVAQVDSAIGGKTGVNLPEGKNLVGAFYPPEFVIADPELLGTLPDRQYRSGLYEVVKYGVIGDAALFSYLERNMPAVLRRDPKALAWIIARCVRAKASVVTKDERESGLRQILNFGHTLGHAIETATRYRKLLHGEAVGWGMIGAALLSYVTDRLDFVEAQRVIRGVLRVGPLPDIGNVTAARLLQLTRGDKKSRRGRARWVLARDVGDAAWGIDVPDALVLSVIREMPEIARLARGRA
jgi:3-dehydroquinate synthase